MMMSMAMDTDTIEAPQTAAAVVRLPAVAAVSSSPGSKEALNVIHYSAVAGAASSS